VVGTLYLGVYLGIGYLWQQPLGGDEVVDAPSGVLLAGLEAVRPPGVGDLLGIQRAEGVDEAASQQVGEGLALLIRKTGIHAVGLGVLHTTVGGTVNHYIILFHCCNVLRTTVNPTLGDCGQ